MNVNTSQNDTGVVKGKFRQCTLCRKEEFSVTTKVSLIPEKFCKLGKLLELEDNDKWNTWIVIFVSDTVSEDPIDSRVLIKAHRRATGDSMPKMKGN
jgi:hypothetical protein